ncbi:phosphatase PAP2 family protein [Luteimonas pelagia]
MSNANTRAARPTEPPPDAGPTRRALHRKLWTLLVEARFGANFLRRYWRRVLLVFALLLLPLWGFAELADEVQDGDPFAFDKPMLRWAHAWASPGADRFMAVVTHLGYEWFVVPFDVLLVLLLAWKGRMREGLFAALALGGSALLNMATKQLYARERPDLWVSLLPEHTYSFPSGHAMGSMTLACVAILLAWRTPWRWPVLVVAGGFALLVGASRVYFGVHYPSDILAGWTAAMVWTATAFVSVFHHHRHPWERPEAVADDPEDV